MTFELMPESARKSKTSELDERDVQGVDVNSTILSRT
jgi:hypothetical protein